MSRVMCFFHSLWAYSALLPREADVCVKTRVYIDDPNKNEVFMILQLR